MSSMLCRLLRGLTLIRLADILLVMVEPSVLPVENISLPPPPSDFASDVAKLVDLRVFYSEVPHPVRQVGHHEGFVTNPVYFE